MGRGWGGALSDQPCEVGGALVGVLPAAGGLWWAVPGWVVEGCAGSCLEAVRSTTSCTHQSRSLSHNSTRFLGESILKELGCRIG